MNKLLVPLLLIGLGLIGLLAMGLMEGVPEIQVRELAAGTYGERTVKVHGLLHEIQPGERPLRFTIRDKDRPDVLTPVWHAKGKPDTFQVGFDVACEGAWDAKERRFVAERIFTKCPSKYEDEAKQGIGSKEAWEKKQKDEARSRPQ